MSTANIARLEKWTWILIFVGIVLLAFGLSLQGRDALLGWGIALPGAALIVVGIVLVWVRSRIKISEEKTP